MTAGYCKQDISTLCQWCVCKDMRHALLSVEGGKKGSGGGGGGKGDGLTCCCRDCSVLRRRALSVLAVLSAS